MIWLPDHTLPRSREVHSSGNSSYRYIFYLGANIIAKYICLSILFSQASPNCLVNTVWEWARLSMAECRQPARPQGGILPRRERAPQGPSSSTRSCWFCSECLVWAVFRCSPTQPFWTTRMGLGLEVLPVLRLKLVKSVSGSSGSSAALYLGNQ